eukprot:519750-Pleurochrysis_carterae.AAC.3
MKTSCASAHRDLARRKRTGRARNRLRVRTRSSVRRASAKLRSRCRPRHARPPNGAVARPIQPCIRRSPVRVHLARQAPTERGERRSHLRRRSYGHKAPHRCLQCEAE